MIMMGGVRYMFSITDWLREYETYNNKKPLTPELLDMEDIYTCFVLLFSLIRMYG